MNSYILNKIIYMKAAILKESNKPLIVEEIEIPNELQYGQVLVKISYSGICGAQINEIEAVKGPDKFLPHLLGHEGSGVVEKVADGVSKVKPGDHVVLHWKQGMGIQSVPPKYILNNNNINAGWVTTFNEKAIVSENRITVIPKNFNLRTAPLFGCAVTTAFGVINNDAQLKIGQSVIIFGLGGVGLNLVQAASMVSASTIIGIDLHTDKIDIAKKYGLTHGILASKGNLVESIKEILSKGADVAIDTTGIPEVIEKAYELTDKNGKTILVGVPYGKINIYSLPLHFKKILKGSHGGSSVPDRDIPRYIKLIEQNKMSLDELITHEFPLKKINDAIKLFKTGKAGKIIIKMQD